jgi:hypothetical protein
MAARHRFYGEFQVCIGRELAASNGPLHDDTSRIQAPLHQRIEQGAQRGGADALRNQRWDDRAGGCPVVYAQVLLVEVHEI